MCTRGRVEHLVLRRVVRGAGTEPSREPGGGLSVRKDRYLGVSDEGDCGLGLMYLSGSDNVGQSGNPDDFGG